MTRWIALTLAIFLSSALSATAQGDRRLTESETEEVRAVAMRFVDELQKSHDVRPLEKEYFLPGHESLVPESLLLKDEFYSRLNLTDRRRLRLAEINYLYILSVRGSVKPRGDCFPWWFHEKFEEKQLRAENLTKAQNADRVGRFERYLAAAARYITHTKMTSDPAYLAELSRYPIGEEDNYRIESGVFKEVSDEATGKSWSEPFRARYPNGVRYFTSTTPVGLRLVFVREKGELKIFMIGPYPWD